MQKNFFNLVNLENTGPISTSEIEILNKWVVIYTESLNNSKSYKDAAKNWEGSMILAFEKSDKTTVAIFLDLWHGECRSAVIIHDPTQFAEKVNSPDMKLMLSGPAKNWIKETQKTKPNLTQALMTGQLKIKGDMSVVMKYGKAAGILGHYFMKTTLDV
jgi:putative sterol carrier protein